MAYLVTYQIFKTELNALFFSFAKFTCSIMRNR